MKRNLFAINGLFLLAFCFSAACVYAQTNNVVWESDLNRAAALARETKRPLFLHFYGNNCPPCKAMDSSVFTDARVAAELGKNFVAVKLDTSQNPELAKKFEITAIPTDILLDENGSVLNRRQGGISADRFCQYLAYLQTNFAKPQTQQAPQQPAHQLAGNFPVTPSASQTVPQPEIAAKPIPAQANETVLRDPFTKQPVQEAVVPVPVPAAASTVPANQAVSASVQTVPVQTAQIQAVPVSTPALPNQDSVFSVVASTFDTPVQTDAMTQPPATVSSAPMLAATERSNPVRPEPANGFAPVSTAFLSQNNPASPVLPSADCATISTQTVEVPLGLEGYCPVVLGNEERWTPGNPALYVMFRGHVYRFSSEQAMSVFVQNPMKYAPIAMGEDIVLMVERNKKSYGTRKFGAWYDGRVYLFSCQESLNAFAAKPEYYAEIAQKYETAFKSPMDTIQR